MARLTWWAVLDVCGGMAEIKCVFMFAVECRRSLCQWVVAWMQRSMRANSSGACLAARKEDHRRSSGYIGRHRNFPEATWK
ncbi:hypothetical protein F4809DRAFT_634066 [Biscogniauxia mediterranea]|nr:hypothetical protein F4809DRAFT_634066 [Biscogniauxia mediterranea]